MNKRDFLSTFGAVALGAVSAGLASPSARAAAPAVIRVGVAGGVDEEIWEVVTQVALERGLRV